MKNAVNYMPTLLENGFPLERLHTIATREGNSKRPIYQIHKWWARRLGSVFRMLLLSSFEPAHETSTNLWSKYYNGTSLNGKILLDPMMGGGTSVIEGLRLGCKVIGIDVNPVAWFVTKKEAEAFDAELADRYFADLERSIGNTIKQYYLTTCPNGHDADVLYVLWIQKLHCKGCRKVTRLFKDYVVYEDNTLKVLVCPKCSQIFHSRSKSDDAICKYCKKKFNIRKGPVLKGLFHCPKCNKKESIIGAVSRYGQPLPSDMFCIEYDCQTCGRGYKIPTKVDKKTYQEALAKFEKNKKSLSYPRQKISVNGRSDGRPISHGYKYFHQLFNPRQLLCLSLLFEKIKKIPDENMREFFLIAFSSCLETNNRLCKYESKWKKISALFSIPGYHPVQRYGENNVWGSSYGRGTFVKSYEKLKRAKLFASSTYELLYKERSSERKATGERICAKMAKSYTDLVKSERDTLLMCKDSASMDFIPDKSVHAILTDPPYFDNLMYSELADFFYVWLRLALKNRYSWFRAESSRRSNEIIMNSNSGKDKKTFVEELTDVFKECRRVVKDDGIMVFTFHHTKVWAWKGIRDALTKAGFAVTAAPVIRSEGRTGYRKGNSISYDVCVVCRKKHSTSTGFEDGTFNERILIRDSLKVARRLYKIDPALRDSDIFTIIMGQLLRHNGVADNDLFHKHKSVVPIIKNELQRSD